MRLASKNHYLVYLKFITLLIIAIHLNFMIVRQTLVLKIFWNLAILLAHHSINSSISTVLLDSCLVILTSLSWYSVAINSKKFMPEKLKCYPVTDPGSFRDPTLDPGSVKFTKYLLLGLGVGVSGVYRKRIVIMTLDIRHDKLDLLYALFEVHTPHISFFQTFQKILTTIHCF